MTRRRPCPAAPGPLEDYAARFDDLFGSLAQRRGFREYLAGLLAPRDRNKTLTALAGAEPVAGAQHPAVQRLQFFLSESRWDPEQADTVPASSSSPPAPELAGKPTTTLPPSALTQQTTASNTGNMTSDEIPPGSLSLNPPAGILCCRG